MRSLGLGIEHRQQQVLSPRLQQAVRLLQLSSLDFAQEVNDALGKNPFLETDEADSESPADAAAALDGMPPPSVDPLPGLSDIPDMPPDTSVEANDADNDSFDAERDNWQIGGLPASRNNADGDANPLDLRAHQASLTDHLLRQLHVLPLSSRDLTLAEVIVGSLDDDGYLRCALSDLLGIADLDPPPGEEELHIALSRVQSLDPDGIGARNVRECLLLQLGAIDPPRARELARQIIGEHLDALAARDVPGLARALCCPPVEIQSVLECIRRLDPHPGWRFGAAQIEYVTPDVVIRKIRGEWTALLNPAIVPKVRLNQVYAEMFRRNRCAQHAELAAHLQEARWMVSNVEQRFVTILNVAQAIVGHQRHFLDFGPLAMKPLGLRDIADEVGLHESTVSRVTNNKYMATPLGVFELKYFFSRAMTSASGGAYSATAIRGLIKDMIAAEAPQAPLSDAEIAHLLARQGLVVARRTVTKYRQILRIEAFERRRKLA